MRIRLSRRMGATLLLPAFLAACATSAPDPTRQAGPEMAKVLTNLAAMNPIPIQTLSAVEARKQPSAAMAALATQRLDTGSATPQPPVALVRDFSMMGAAGPLPARLYDPAPGGASKPVVLYFGGGGWVIADLDTYDGGARGLAHGTGAIVVSVQYRRGPENRFPAAHDDAIAAWRWLAANAASIGADPRRMALAGESAGGNLALATAIAARDMPQLAKPVAEILIYPVAGTSTATRSAGEYVNAKPLGTPQLPWFIENYVGDASVAGADPRLNPVTRADLRNLPPTTIVLAQIDPLRSGGEMLAEKMREAGTPVELQIFSGATHEFFGMAAVVPQARMAQAFAAERLRLAFAGTPPQPEPVRRRR